MTPSYIISLSKPAVTLAEVGGKGASLARLIAAGLPVPGGFHITTAAYRRFVESNELYGWIQAALDVVDPARPATLESASNDIRSQFLAAEIPAEIAEAMLAAYADLPGEDPAVAVRSSATAEDLPEASFAGQQETYLNVRGPEAVLEAARKCWASLWTARAIGYRIRQGIAPDQVALAVVVQTLVPAEVAGILFTANPMDGQRDQSVISASWGLGEAVVGGAVTPDSLVLDKTSGKVISRQTADKQVMTSLHSQGVLEELTPEELRRAPALDDPAAAELNHLGLQIEALYGMPMDIEWARMDDTFYILQARPITALPEPPPEMPFEWHLPDPKAQYMRASICELMPDPLTPLFSTLGFPAIEDGIDRLMLELMNMPSGSLSGFMTTVDGYAYQMVSFTRRQWYLMITCMFPRVPRMLREGVPFWKNVGYPRYAEATARWKERNLDVLPASEIWDGVQELMKAFAYHLGTLMTSTMGPSAGSEGLFTRVYKKLVKRPGDPDAPVFLMGYDSRPILAEKALFDLASWCWGQEPLRAYLRAAPAEQVASQFKSAALPLDVPGELWGEFCYRFRRYLDDHGYSIYDMDFAKPLPMDEPGPILETLKLFVAGQGKNPYQRQQASAERREQAVAAALSRVKGFKRWAFQKSLKWAQSQAPLREDGIAEIGLGYPALRRLLLELGRRFAEAGAIRQDEDIFWLEAHEVAQGVLTLDQGRALVDHDAQVQERRALWQVRKRLSPPAQLPIGMKYLGGVMDGVMAVGDTDQKGDTLKGVGASPGQASGAARVLHGPQDFDRMQPGDVLVASITTPAWTPLFALASAVVTDIGGPLSHGSIVAREYGIPAVLGTGNASRRIQDGQQLIVDGSAGVVTLLGAGSGNGRQAA